MAYAYTAFACRPRREVEFRGAADDNFTVWVNGQRVFGFEEYRNGVRLDRHRFPVKLKRRREHGAGQGLPGAGRPDQPRAELGVPAARRGSQPARASGLSRRLARRSELIYRCQHGMQPTGNRLP